MTVGKAKLTTALPGRIIGIDFSGAADAGKRIWIAVCHAENNRLKVKECYPARDLQSSAERDISLRTLGRFITDQGACICGIDFPFGLPRSPLTETNWEEFIINFSNRYQCPEDFRQKCFDDNGGHECRRATDHEAKTPLSPYNWRLFRQTFFGIRDLLAPIVKAKSACILPMQRPLPGRTWLIEVCPASTLKRLGLYDSYHYKGRKEGKRDVRAGLLRRLEAKGDLQMAEQHLKSTLVENSGGDALDSVIAAIATLRALRNPNDLYSTVDPYGLEGRVYW